MCLSCNHDNIVQMVGALNTAPGKPLPANLQQFLDQKVPSSHPSGTFEEAGAVYVSMGTAVHLLEPEIHALAANLAALNRPVLWKISNFELPGTHLNKPQMAMLILCPHDWRICVAYVMCRMFCQWKPS